MQATPQAIQGQAYQIQPQFHQIGQAMPHAAQPQLIAAQDGV